MAKKKSGYGMLLIYILALVLAGVWQFTPLSEYATPEYLHRLSGALNEKWWAAPATVLVYIITGFAVFPLTVLIATTILIFGGLKGGAYALIGSLASAFLFFLIGRSLGLARLKKYETPRFKKWTTFLRRGGVGTVVAVRLLPVAPFTVANLMCGALGIGIGVYGFGTLLALIPGIGVMALMRDQIADAVTNFNVKTAVALVGAIVFSFGLMWILQKFASKREARL